MKLDVNMKISDILNQLMGGDTPMTNERYANIAVKLENLLTQECDDNHQSIDVLVNFVGMYLGRTISQHREPGVSEKEALKSVLEDLTSSLKEGIKHSNEFYDAVNAGKPCPSCGEIHSKEEVH